MHQRRRKTGENRQMKRLQNAKQQKAQPGQPSRQPTVLLQYEFNPDAQAEPVDNSREPPEGKRPPPRARLSGGNEKRDERERRQPGLRQRRESGLKQHTRQRRQHEIHNPRAVSKPHGRRHPSEASALSNTESAMYELRTNGPLNTILNPIEMP